LDRREGNVDVLLLTPKESGSGPAVSLRLWVPDSGLPEKTELISKSVKTLLETKALEINPVLPKDFFSFTIPPGADVLSDKKGTDK
jgi:outer membrane lipoprotein-sorting protein